MKKMLSAFVTTLVVIGVVLGVWRFLGDGADITDPEWPRNAYETIKEWSEGADDTIGDRTERIPAPRLGRKAGL